MGGFNAAIPLQAFPDNEYNPINNAYKLAQLRAAGIDEQTARLKLAEFQRQQQQQANVRNAARSAVTPAKVSMEGVGLDSGAPTQQPAQFDRNKFVANLNQSDPLAGMDFQNQFAAQDVEKQKQSAQLAEALSKAHSQQLDQISKELEISGRALSSFKQVVPPEEQPKQWTVLRSGLIQQGIAHESQLPEQFPGTAGLDGLIQQGMSIKDQVEAERQNRIAKETNRHNVATENNTVRGQDLVNQRAIEKNKIDAAKKTEGEQALDAVAQQLADPRNLTALKDVVSMRGDQRAVVFTKAKAINPGFDPGVTNQRIKFLQSYEDPKGRAATNRQAINNILQHGADLLDLNNQYRRSDVRVLNTPINAIARTFGDSTYTQFQTVNGVLKDELALYFAGGYAPSADQQKMWNKIQADEATPAQTEAFAREVGRLGFRRANTFNSQFKGVMGYNDPNLLIPEAVTAAEKLGLGQEAKKFGSGGQIGNDQPSQGTGGTAGWDATATGANGHKIGARGGVWYDIQTGKPI